MAIYRQSIRLHRPETDSFLTEVRKIPMSVFRKMVERGRDYYVQYIDECAYNDFPGWELLGYHLPDEFITEGLMEEDEDADADFYDDF